MDCRRRPALQTYFANGVGYRPVRSAKRSRVNPLTVTLCVVYSPSVLHTYESEINSGIHKVSRLSGPFYVCLLPPVIMNILESIPFKFSLVGNASKLATALVALPAAVVLAHLVSYFLDPFNQRRIPGPLLAKFSDLWLGWTASQGHRSDVVHKLHQKYGTVPV